MWYTSKSRLHINWCVSTVLISSPGYSPPTLPPFSTGDHDNNHTEVNYLGLDTNHLELTKPFGSGVKPFEAGLAYIQPSLDNNDLHDRETSQTEIGVFLPPTGEGCMYVYQPQPHRWSQSALGSLQSAFFIHPSFIYSILFQCLSQGFGESYATNIGWRQAIHTGHVTITRPARTILTQVSLQLT